MTNSARKINYSLSPAKSIERQMLIEVFNRLSLVSVFTDYQYIGFGEKYFVDFKLAHKYLHVNKMISIEVDTRNQQRYIFNKPYRCIDIVFGNSNDVLPKLDLSSKTIAWLNYENHFNKGVLGDISILCEQCPSGTIICISYCSETYKIKDLRSEFPDLKNGHYRRKFENIFGYEHIPVDFDERGNSDRKKHSRFIRKCVISQIESSLAKRNIALPEGDFLNYKQIAYFDYADGDDMSSLAFYIFNETISEALNSCNLDDFFFHSHDDKSYEIVIPNLTTKEIRFLMEKMPCEDGVSFDNSIFVKEDIVEFCKNYKYYPNYMEVDSF